MTTTTFFNKVEIKEVLGQAVVLATTSNYEGTKETLAVKQVEGRLEDCVKAAIREAENAFFNNADDAAAAAVSVDEMVTDAVSENADDSLAATDEVVVEDEQVVETVADDVVKAEAEVVKTDAEPKDVSEEEMVIPAPVSDAELEELISDDDSASTENAEETATVAETEIPENAEETSVPETVPENGSDSKDADETVTEESEKQPAPEEAPAVPETETTDNADVKEPTPSDDDDFLVTIGGHSTAPIMVSEAARLLLAGDRKEHGVLKGIINTAEWIKTRKGVSPNIAKQVQDYLRYVSAKGVDISKA